MKLDIPSGRRPRRRRADRCAAAVAAGVGAAGGVVLGYVLGHRDRLTRVRARTRRDLRRARRALRLAAKPTLGRERGRMLALYHRLRPVEHEEVDDVTLTHRVESIVFRDPHLPKGRVSINAEDGAVFLRGEVDSQALIQDLVHSVAAVRGVHRVENLLHLPGTPAPHPHGGALLGRPDAD